MGVFLHLLSVSGDTLSLPHVRGVFPAKGEANNLVVSLPTSVGVFLGLRPAARKSASLPHVRGGVS